MPTTKNTTKKLGPDVAPLKPEKPQSLERSVITGKVDSSGNVAISEAFAGKMVTIIVHSSHVKVEEAASAFAGEVKGGKPTMRRRTLVIQVNEPV